MAETHAKWCDVSRFPAMIEPACTCGAWLQTSAPKKPPSDAELDTLGGPPYDGREPVGQAVAGRFRKKPVVVEAAQMTAVDFNWQEGCDGAPFRPMAQWVVDAVATGVLVPGTPRNTDYAEWRVTTLEGEHWGMPGDWLIRGVKGELYFCKPDIFAATYEPADASAPPSDSETNRDATRGEAGSDGLNPQRIQEGRDRIVAGEGVPLSEAVAAIRGEKHQDVEPTHRQQQKCDTGSGPCACGAFHQSSSGSGQEARFNRMLDEDADKWDMWKLAFLAAMNTPASFRSFLRRIHDGTALDWWNENAGRVTSTEAGSGEVAEGEREVPSELYYCDGYGEVTVWTGGSEDLPPVSFDADDLPVELYEGAPGGWSVFSGEIISLTAEHLADADHPASNYAPKLVVGDQWWDGHLRRATKAEVVAFFGLPEPPSTPAKDPAAHSEEEGEDADLRYLRKQFGPMDVAAHASLDRLAARLRTTREPGGPDV